VKKILTLTLLAALIILALPVQATLAQDDSPASLVPADAPFYISVNTAPGFDQAIDALVQRFGAEPVAADALDELAQTILFDRNATFEGSIRPWLGDEVAIAMTNFPPLSTLAMAGANDMPVDLALIAEVSDTAAAQEFLDLLITSPTLADVTFDPREYAGYSYYLINPLEPPDATVGFVDNYLVVGLGLSAVTDVIDTVKGAPSLAADDGFDRVYGAMPTDSALRAYVGPGLFTGIFDDPMVTIVLGQAFMDPEVQTQMKALGLDVSSPAALQQQLVDFANSIDGLGVAFHDGNGNALVMDLFAGMDLAQLETLTGAAQEMMKPVNSEIYTLLPADTLGMLAATNLAGVWDRMVEVASITDPTTVQDVVTIEREIETRLGQSLDDVLSWMRGSYVIGVLDNPDYDPTNEKELPVDLLVIFEATDLDKAQMTLDSVTSLVEMEAPEVTIGASTAGDVEITTFETENGEIQAALVDGYMVLSLGDVIPRVVEAKAGDNYTTTPTWLRVTNLANAEGPFAATLEVTRLINLAAAIDEAMSDVLILPKDQETLTMLSMFETLAIVAPAAEGDGPAQVSFIITLAE